VICSNGNIGGYSGSGGIEKKKTLLKEEGVNLF
jgi:O6-methylguanine-DNA--protein-cysteine methyltransferase